MFRALVEDEERSRQICGDVAAAIEIGRNCLVLTQWTDISKHCLPNFNGSGSKRS